MMNRIGLWSLLLLLSVSSAQAANTYYVATSGSNSNLGTQAAPFRDINRGIQALSSGDTLYVRGGTYNEQISSPVNARIPSGTPQQPTTIAGYPGETAILTRETRVQDGFDSVPVSYVLFTNFTVRAPCSGPFDNGFSFGGTTHHVRVTESDITACTGVVIANSTDHIEIASNLIHDAPAPFTSAYGMYINGNHMLIENNHIYNNSGYAIHLYSSGANNVSDNVIRGNIIYGNCFDDGVRNQALNAVIISSGSNNYFYNNILYNNNCLGGGPAITAAYYNGGGNNYIYNNTVYNNNGGGIEINTTAPNTTVQNNIAYNNGSRDIVDLGASGTVLSNNLTTDPSFEDAGAANFKLKAGSAARDMGIAISVVQTDKDGVVRPQGAAYDIGAYEYVDSSCAVRGGPNPTLKPRAANCLQHVIKQ
jgi:parallel beta-helix repeat protein